MNYDEVMHRLSVMELNISDGGIDINVLWFRPAEMAEGTLITRHRHS